MKLFENKRNIIQMNNKTNIMTEYNCLTQKIG